MSPTEERAQRVGLIALLAAVVLHSANTLAVRFWWNPVPLGDGDSVADYSTFSTILAISALVLFACRAFAYVKLMGGGNIRNKALALLILSVVTFALGFITVAMVQGSSHVTNALVRVLPLSIIDLIASILLIRLLVQAAQNARGELHKLVSGTYLGLVVVAFTVGLVGIVWQLADPSAWFFERESIAGIAKTMVTAIGTVVYYLIDGVQVVALVIVLRVLKSATPSLSPTR